MNLRLKERYITILYILVGLFVTNLGSTQTRNEQFITNIIAATPINTLNSSIQVFNVNHTVEIVSQNHYGIKSLNNLGVNGYYLINNKNLIVLKSKILFFEEIYNSKLKLGYYRKLLPKLSGGFEFSYTENQIDDLNKVQNYNIDLSLSLIISPKLIVAMQIKELYPTSIPLYSSSMHLDVYYKINENLIGTANLSKKLHQPLETVIGLFYRIKKSYFNLYVNPQRVNLSYSLGYRFTETLDFKIGNAFHHKLGISTKMSVAYSF